MTEKTKLLILLSGILGFAVIVGTLLWINRPVPVPKSLFGNLPDLGGSYSVVDETGVPFTEKSLPGKYRIYFFGFTYCPDVCPTALGTVATALDTLGKQADAFVPLFVTVDPERDTVDVVRDYTDAFDPRIIGLTGSPQQIAVITKAFKIYYSKVPQGDSYTMAHSGLLYVMNPEGKLVAFFSHEDTPEKLAAGLREALQNRRTRS